MKTEQKQSRLKDKLKYSAIRKTVAHIKKNPDKNFTRLLRLSRYFIRTEFFKRNVGKIESMWEDKESTTYQLIRRALDTLSQNAITKIVFAFFIKGGMEATELQESLREEMDINIPWTILMDPTSACNLKCKGCWAAEYSKRDNLTLEELDSIIRQGKEIGVHYFIYSGGEPLVRKDDLLTLAERHGDCMFMAFTNGTLIDEAFAKKLGKLGNFGFALSIEGFETATDARRGTGTYRSVMRAMDILRKHGIAFGFSACYTAENYQAIGSDAFIDVLMEKGCLFGWLFTYIPIGKDAVMDLMITPEQREYMYHFVRRIRIEKPIFLLDFWNDGEFVNGCIAGGRRYLHINASGDVEPCAFIHYSGANIREMSLMEALKQPLFRQYHQNQPFNENMLRPCPLLDNPEMLRAMVEESGAVSTQPVDRENVADLTEKTKQTAENWAETADRLWEVSDKQRNSAMKH